MHKIELLYPSRQDETARTVEVDLIDVRAARPIRVVFDFARDGWRIDAWSETMTEVAPNVFEGSDVWTEVFFLPSWDD